MALKASIFKLALTVSDMNRQHYDSYALTLARHPSETDERMMMRVLAFALQADEQLSFGKGLSCDDEPDLWRKSLSGDVQQWIDVGMPSEERCRKACKGGQQALVYSYGTERNIELWWKKIEKNLQRFERLTVMAVYTEASQALAQMARTNMELQITIDGNAIYVSDDEQTLTLEPSILKQGLTDG